MDQTSDKLLNEPKAADPQHESAHNPKQAKFDALFNARFVLSKIGTMKEREVCKRQLERMKKLGINSL